MAADQKLVVFRFGEFEVSEQEFLLVKAGEAIPVEPKAFRVLLFLLHNPGRLIKKDEILNAVWDDCSVSDNSLTRSIATLRRLLGDDARAPRYIETVPTVGYRFLGDCTEEHLPGAFETADRALADALAPAQAATQARLRKRRWAAIAGAAMVVVPLAVAGWWFYLRKTPALSNKDTIVLADFANSTGDPVFDDALKQGLAVELGQSPLLNILSEQRVRSALKEMTRSPDDSVTPSVALEVCERTGSSAYIAGTIASMGGHYVIGLNAIHCATGDVLAREQIEARDKQQVLATLDLAAEKLRGKLGESLNSIKKLDVPLAQATTSSLEALKAYSLGQSKSVLGDLAGAVPLFQQAIDLDPDFASAYANLGRAYHVLGPSDLEAGALRKAFALRNRTSEREKFEVSADYYQMITGQTDQAIENCELWARAYPLDANPHRILGFENGVLGRIDRSIEEYRKAIELDPKWSLQYGGLMLDYMALNRLPEAHAVYQQAEARKLEPGEGERIRYLLAFIEGDRQTMAKVAASLAGRPGHENNALFEESLTEAYFGHLGRVEELSRRAKVAALGKGDRTTAAEVEDFAASIEALFGNSSGARKHEAFAQSLGGHPTVDLAVAGDLAMATHVADRLAGSSTPGDFASKVWLPEVRAAIELKRGNPMGAVELLAPVMPFEGGWTDRYQSAYVRGEAYLAARKGPEAAEEFQKVVNHPGVVVNSTIGALARLGVARSYAIAGDTTKSGAAYRDFLALWEGADPDIPILMAAKSEYAKMKR